MKCPNSFTCASCHKQYQRITPIEKQQREHEERAKMLLDYDLNDEIVEVCDPCYQKIMAYNLGAIIV
jgi:hypothetical protein